MSIPDFGPVWLSARLALTTVIVLLAFGTPLAWWLARTRSRLKPPAEALVTLPLVLPPTVLGFYLLILLGPAGPIGSFWLELTDSTLTFSFTGLVVASVVYSLPFTVQPLQTAFESISQTSLDAASTLGASPAQRFLHHVIPASTRGFVTAAVLTFAHTLGEFGVVLMVGGNIPGQTRVISIAIYEHVETINYADAHLLAAGLLVISFLILLAVYVMNRRSPVTSRLV